MKQLKNETINEFSHRFVNTQLQLETLIVGIHRMLSDEETELLYAYTIKLKPKIKKELVSRDFRKFKKLSVLIETAERYELCVQTKNLSNSLENWFQGSCKESGHFKYNCPKQNGTNYPKPVIRKITK